MYSYYFRLNLLKFYFISRDFQRSLNYEAFIIIFEKISFQPVQTKKYGQL